MSEDSWNDHDHLEESYTGTGQLIKHHSINECVGEHCCIHRPSNHHMVMWPVHFRADRPPLMERICPIHGTGHPDPDCLSYLETVYPDMAWGIHGCCGCCIEPENSQI